MIVEFICVCELVLYSVVMVLDLVEVWCYFN